MLHYLCNIINKQSKHKGYGGYLERLRPITLEEMDGIRLMNRTDTKFVTSMDKALPSAPKWPPGVQGWEIDGKRIAYYTVCFDDQLWHVLSSSGQPCQPSELRIRSYVDSNLTFLEIKTKNNPWAHRQENAYRCRLLIRWFLSMISSSSVQNPEFEVYDEFLRKNLHYEPMLL